MIDVLDDEFTSKYQQMDSASLEQIAKYHGVAMLMDNAEVQLSFNEVKQDLLNTIPLTDADASADRESLFLLHKAVGLLEHNLRAKANEFHALRASQVRDDKQADLRQQANYEG